MKKSIKKIVEVILAIVFCIAFVLMFAEKKDGSICLPWTLGCIATLAISAKILDKMGVFETNN